MIVDLFAGPGGWDEGLAAIGRTDVVGLEWDKAACQTAKAAGHARIRCDVAQYPTEPFAGVEGVIASPPCQAWSMAGKRKGEQDRSACHELADRMAAGDDSTDWTAWEDPRSPLVCQPVRWVRDLSPEWVALEEVPAVASLWEHFARIFRAWGYSVWTGDLNAADYGVPQTRTRRILMAHKRITVQPPTPTHAEHPQGADLFGGELLPWVSMAQALGWGMHPRPCITVTAGSGRQGGPDPLDGGSGARETIKRERAGGRWVPNPQTQPADTLTGKGTAYWTYRGSNQAHAAKRRLDEPAPVVNFAERSNKVEWFHTRPATTIVSGHNRSSSELPNGAAGGGVRVSVEEGGVLQSFPADYPWRGTRTKQFQQVGNAIPPRLAAHVLTALGVAASAEVAA